MSDVRRTEMYCHACGGTFVAALDMDLNGNHEITCPCGHIHYRVVEDGEVTAERYRSSAGYTFTATTYGTTYSLTSTSSGTTSDVFLSDAWANSSSVTWT